MFIEEFKREFIQMGKQELLLSKLENKIALNMLIFRFEKIINLNRGDYYGTR